MTKHPKLTGVKQGKLDESTCYGELYRKEGIILRHGPQQCVLIQWAMHAVIPKIQRNSFKSAPKKELKDATLDHA